MRVRAVSREEHYRMRFSPVIAIVVVVVVRSRPRLSGNAVLLNHRENYSRAFN